MENDSLGRSCAVHRFCVTLLPLYDVKGGLGKTGAEWKMTAWEGVVLSIFFSVSELLHSEAVNGELAKTGAEWKMTAWEGCVLSIGPVSQILPSYDVNWRLGNTGAERKMTAWERGVLFMGLVSELPPAEAVKGGWGKQEPNGKCQPGNKVWCP